MAPAATDGGRPLSRKLEAPLMKLVQATVVAHGRKLTEPMTASPIPIVLAGLAGPVLSPHQFCTAGSVPVPLWMTPACVLPENRLHMLTEWFVAGASDCTPSTQLVMVLLVRVIVPPTSERIST